MEQLLWLWLAVALAVAVMLAAADIMLSAFEVVGGTHALLPLLSWGILNPLRFMLVAVCVGNIY